MKTNKTVHLVIFGVGNVGKTLVNQVLAGAAHFEQKQQLTIKIPVITNSRFMLLKKDGINDAQELDLVANKDARPYDVKKVIDFVLAEKFKHLIAIDATASTDFVVNYIPLIQHGFHIVSANKVANTLPMSFYETLRQTLKAHRKQFLYETNVGAGLPVIDTVRNFYESGENITKIRGVFSGSLSYIFNTFSSGTISFSEVLKNARELGLTEPDIREDLSGNDVARKLLILARELSLKYELEDVSVRSLIPTRLSGEKTATEFYSSIHELDDIYRYIKDHSKNGGVLRYVGELDIAKKTLDVKLISEESDTAIGQLKGADSVFEIYTESYGDLPVVIRGAGAGKEVTARGVLSDILKLSSTLN